MSGQCSIWGLPECIWQGVLSQLLAQRDVGNLDSACCNHQLRQMLLMHLAACVADFSCTPMTQQYYQWSLLRGILLRIVMLPSAMVFSIGLCKSLLRANSSHLLELHVTATYNLTDILSFVAKKCTSLKYLLVHGHDFHEFALVGVLLIDSLENICLHGGKLTGRGDSLRLLPLRPNLRHLQLLDVNFEEPLYLQVLDRCPNLCMLMVRGARNLTARGMTATIRTTAAVSSYAFLDTPHLQGMAYRVIAERGVRLTALSLMHASVSDADMLVIVSHCRSLRGLSLFGCALLTTITVLNIARYCPLLEDLDLDKVHDVDDAAVMDLVSKCPNLWGLSLPKSGGITDKSITYLGLNCKILTHLRLYYNPPSVTARTFPMFRSLLEFTPVGYL
jgi:hypothetical protein